MKKIVIIGPESTGKSYLSEVLAKEFDATLVPEYAREYLLKHNSSYTYEELDIIAKGQLAREDQAIKSLQGEKNKLLILDTDLQVIMVWSEFVFNRCKSWILQEIAERTYDLFLLCKPDIPWVKDELREYPDLQIRKTLFHYYHAILQEQPTPFVVIEGDYEKRTAAAIDAVAGIS